MMVYQVELLGDITAYSFRNMVMHSCDTIKLSIKENCYMSVSWWWIHGDDNDGVNIETSNCCGIGCYQWNTNNDDEFQLWTSHVFTSTVSIY